MLRCSVCESKESSDLLGEFPPRGSDTRRFMAEDVIFSVHRESGDVCGALCWEDNLGGPLCVGERSLMTDLESLLSWPFSFKSVPWNSVYLQACCVVASRRRC